MPSPLTTDVLIIGAGPTGTTLAIDLVRRGVRVRLIDKAVTAFDGSRAKGVQPRTLEVFEDLGVLPDILKQGSDYPKMGIHIGPLTIPWRMLAKGRRGPDVPYPDTWLIPQNATIAALHQRLESLGCVIEYGTELVEFGAENTKVTAQLATGSGIEMVTARYLVGADGGSSCVRSMADIDFGGTTDEADRMLIVDATVRGGLSRNYWHVWPGLFGRFAAACPLPHSDLFQWMIRLAPDEEPPGTAEEISKKIRSVTGDMKLALGNVTWQSVFRPNIRLASRYRHGPVLLAGDAAHVHTPAGAQGMNTGIGDAYNLGWKLAQVLAGARDALLDTYEAERHPVAEDVLGLSTKKYEGLAKLDPRSARRGTDEKQLTLTYHGGPLALSSGGRTATLRVGDRAPDASLVTADDAGLRLFEAFEGPHFTAISYGPVAAAQLEQLQWPETGAHLMRVQINGANDAKCAADAVLTDPTGEFARIYGLDHDSLLLIRPDGYIGQIASEDTFETTYEVIESMTPNPRS